MPSAEPSAGHEGAQHAALYSLLPFAQGHVPVQPSSRPARVPSLGHVGVHEHLPSTQCPFWPQLLPQSQVLEHMPLVHKLPAAQTTPAHGSTRHLPATQTSLPGQMTPVHVLGAEHVRSHAKPAPQPLGHALIALHFPVPGSQN
jgi:hypothetical protein